MADEPILSQTSDTQSPGRGRKLTKFSKADFKTMRLFMEKLVAQGSKHTDFFQDFAYQYAPNMGTEKTKFFICIDLIRPMLYWYNPVHGMLTSKFIILCPMALKCGEILVALWRTRCSAPVMYALFYNPVTKEWRLVKEHTVWRKLLILDPDLEYDRDELLE